MLLPILGQEPSTPVYRTIDEQLYLAARRLAAQPNRHCTVRLVGTLKPERIVTPEVKDAGTTLRWRAFWMQRRYESLPFALPMVEALERIAQRERGIAVAASDEEPQTAKRRVW
jgi:hypothetical protein